MDIARSVWRARRTGRRYIGALQAGRPEPTGFNLLQASYGIERAADA